MAPLRNLFGRRSRPEEKKAEHFDECPFLPDEMLLEIFQHVPPQDLGTCRRVCLRWRDVIDLEVLDSERVRQRRAKKYAKEIKKLEDRLCAAASGAGKPFSSFDKSIVDVPELDVNFKKVESAARQKWEKDHEHQPPQNLFCSHTNLFELTPLIRCAKYGSPKVAKALVSRPDLNINLGDKCSSTPLHYAAVYNRVEVLKVLLAHPDIDVNCKSGCGRYKFTALHYAAAVGHLECIGELLKHPAIDVEVEAEDDGRTPLALAASWYKWDAVKLFLNRVPGINVNKGDMWGGTPLNLAARSKRPDVIRMLVAAPGIDVNAKSREGCTPLHCAAQEYYSPETVKELLAAKGIDPDALNDAGETALEVAVQKSQRSTVRVLLAATNLVNRPQARHGPLQLAAARGNAGVVKDLLASGRFDINRRGFRGRTAMHEAAEGWTEVVAVLAAREDLNLSIKDNSGWTAMDVAASKRASATEVLALLRKSRSWRDKVSVP